MLNNTFLNYTKLSGKIINTDKYIKTNHLKEVTSYNIYKTGTNIFDENGLFSEFIFGSISSPERITNLGYISLNCDVLQPTIYYILKNIKRLYIDILNGTKYAIFNSITKNFELSLEDDYNADTGFNFFISNLYNLKIPKSKSDVKNQYIEVFNKYKDKHILTTDKLLVMPAGLREITKDTKKLARDSINQIYINILSLSNAIDKKLQKDKIYDNVKLMIQNKIINIFDYVTNILKGDSGYLLDKYADRNVALGTRNVLSIDIKTSNSVDSKDNLGPNDVGLSLLQFIKAYQPFIIYNYKTYLSSIINKISRVCNATNPKTFKQTTIYVSSNEAYKHTDNKGIEALLNNMKYENFRNKPITIKSDKDINYYILIKYDLDSIVFWADNIDELKDRLSTYYNIKIDKKKVEPITWYEFLYFIAYTSIENKNKTNCSTRYPVIQPESIKPSFSKVYTTAPSRNITLVLKGNNKKELPRYPILGKKSVESMITNVLTYSGFGADTDGDQLSSTGIYSEDSNEEIINHINSPNAVLQNNGNFQLLEESNNVTIIKALSYKPN